MVRTFIALELSDEVRARLGEAQEVLKRCNARMTWVDQKNIHITVKFLGEVDIKKIPDIKSALKSVSFRSFPIKTGTITTNNPHRPFTVWCTIEDEGLCTQLLDLVERSLAPLGFAREKRKFTPHATVARVRTFDPSLFNAIKSLSSKIYGNCTINGMRLKSSTLTPNGPVYEDLLEVAW
ncbi:MAG: RNA 2',3'-cyclic phosphodiesterase [Methanoregula sp.]|nr:MAG: RNA 2',3'-cyclic phosphodiesterase [Methanoregula sp.]